MPKTHSGFVGLIGRPNVGKSTLLNSFLDQKISITSKKAQTTRQQILGIWTQDQYQIAFVDTPGIQEKYKSGLHRSMNRAARTMVSDVECLLFMIEANRWTEEDKAVLDFVARCEKPVILVINKIDKIKDKSVLLSFMAARHAEFDYLALVPISAKSGEQVDNLFNLIKKQIPENVFLFPEDQITDRSLQFRTTEIVREKLFRFLGEEVPHSISVQLENIEQEDKLIKLMVIIWVERASQKKIVIGQKGENLKKIGTLARVELEKLWSQKVYLNLWVKVKDNWRDSTKELERFGY